MADAQDRSVYFKEGPVLDNLEALAKRTGLSINHIINKVLEAELPRYVRKPQLLIETG